MAGDWIKMRSNICTDPDVVDIAERVSLDEFGVVGRLQALWAWADQHSCDGILPRATSAFVDRLTACPGFAEAMRQVGWLEGRDSALRLPNWDRHNGNSAKTRAMETRKKQRQRDKCPDDRPAPNGTPPGPEKRREEKNKEAPAGGEAAPPKTRKEPDGEHAEFIRRWIALYPEYHEGSEYLFQGGKDGSAVSRLLKSKEKPMDDWERCFVAAWKRPDLFNCAFAASISGFASRFNEIGAEIKAARKGPGTNGDKPDAFRVPMNKPPERPEFLNGQPVS